MKGIVMSYASHISDAVTKLVRLNLLISVVVSMVRFYPFSPSDSVSVCIISCSHTQQSLKCRHSPVYVLKITCLFAIISIYMCRWKSCGRGGKVLGPLWRVVSSCSANLYQMQTECVGVWMLFWEAGC